MRYLKIVVSAALLTMSCMQASPDRTLDEAVEEVYQRKPYLRPTRARRHYEEAHEEPFLTWESLARLVDVATLTYIVWSGYTIRQKLYTQKAPSPEDPFLQTLARALIPPFLQSSSTHLLMCGKIGVMLLQAYVYRVLAGYTLAGIRYGIVAPLTFIAQTVKKLRDY